METKKIYVITTFEKVGVDNHGFPDYGDQRCVGWFDNYRKLSRKPTTLVVGMKAD